MKQTAIKKLFIITLIALTAFSTTPMLTFGAKASEGAKSSLHGPSLSLVGTNGQTMPGTPLAITPFGLVPQACIQYVDSHARLSSTIGLGDTVLLSNGTQIHMSPCVVSNQAIPSAESTPVISDGQGNSSRIPCWWGFGCGSGWVEYATWCYCPRGPPAIYQFDAYWHVPQPPSGNDGQTIFLFSALQPNGLSSYPLAQPVLQWGSAADGGGAYWTVNSWILTSNTNVMYGTIQNVNAGDTIQGLMYSTPTGCDANAACDWTAQDLAQPENS